jgi:hypothetical protein
MEMTKTGSVTDAMTYMALMPDVMLMPDVTTKTPADLPVSGNHPAASRH